MKLVALNIRKSFGDKTVLEDVSLQLDKGGVCGLLGSNGAGKSTLLKIIFGNLKADAGSLFLNQEPFEVYKKFRSQKIGYLPQNQMYPKQLKVKDLIPMTCPDADIQDRIFYTPGIHELTKKWVGSLSEGQRTFLGVVLACHLPHGVVLMDEPFSMTDPKTIEQIKELLVKTSAAKAILITDHYYHDVLEICQKTQVLHQGKLIEVADKKDLKALKYIR